MGSELGYDIFVLSKDPYFDHVDWCDSTIKPFLKEDITKNWTHCVMQARSISLYIMAILKIYLKNLQIVIILFIDIIFFRSCIIMT